MNFRKTTVKVQYKEYKDIFPRLVDCVKKDLENCIAYMKYHLEDRILFSLLKLQNEIWEGEPIVNF